MPTHVYIHLVMFFFIIPGDVVLIAKQSIHEADDSHHRGKKQHLCVEAQPCKVDANLLSIVLPVITGNDVIKHIHN